MKAFDDKFYFKNNEELEKIFSKIPDDTEILITHTPPAGTLDNGLGCKPLAERVKKLSKLKVHLCGMIMYFGTDEIRTYSHEIWY